LEIGSSFCIDWLDRPLSSYFMLLAIAGMIGTYHHDHLFSFERALTNFFAGACLEPPSFWSQLPKLLQLQAQSIGAQCTVLFSKASIKCPHNGHLSNWFVHFSHYTIHTANHKSSKGRKIDYFN
jgi:hypothetical protein